MKKGKREADNVIDKLLSRKKQKKQHKNNRAKVVATSSKYDHDSTSDEDVPLAKKPPLNASSRKDNSSCYEDDSSSAEDAAVSKREEPSGEGSSSEDDSSSTEDAAISTREEPSGEGSSSEDDSSSDDDDDDASKKEECSGKSSSDDDEPNKVKKTSEEPNHSDADKGKAVVVCEQKVDSCGEEEIHCREEPWKDNETEFLIAILYVELVIHQKDVNQIDWAVIVQKLYHQTHKQTSVTEVQTLYKKFRDETNQFMDLLQVAGYEWNTNNNKVTCKDDLWEHIYWIHGGEKVFRKKGLLHYNLLKEIFSSGSKYYSSSVQESDVQRIVHTPPLSSTRLWSWLFG